MYAALEFDAEKEVIDLDIVSENWVDCVVSSSRVSLDILTQYIKAIGRQPIPSDIIDDILYCIKEIAGNAVEWGNKFDKHLRVRISTVVLNDKVIVRIGDEGGGFNARAALEGEDVEKAQLERESQGKRDGGFGMMIVKSKVDEFSYNAKGNKAVFVKYFK